MKPLLFKIVWGYARHTLTGIGGAMVASGALTHNNEVAIIGGIMALLATAWSHYSKIPTDADNGATTN